MKNMNATLTQVEKTAIQLDEARKTRLRSTPVDFDTYMKARSDDIGRIKRSISASSFTTNSLATPRCKGACCRGREAKTSFACGAGN
jgi:hypothetical protein